MLRLLALVVLIVLFSVPAFSADAPPDTLGFELPSGDWFTGWGGAPQPTMFVDNTTVHGGRYAARMERRPGSPSTFSTATRCIPVTFSGHTIELRGWLKMQDVKGGFAGLWMREDSKENPTVQFDNMAKQNLSGTRDWTEYRIVLPLDPKASKICLGALIAAEGTLWADDLELLVDGKPIAEAPAREHVETTIEKDHEFDAGSKVAATDLSKTQVQNLALLGKVWGFVKYHHPRVTAGEVSWDYELFRAIPNVMAAKNAKDAQVAMSSWLTRLGAPAPCTTCATPLDSLHLQPDIAWTRQPKQLGSALAAQLGDIYRNRSAASENHYVSFVREDMNPVFENERPYPEPKYPDAGYRLLALFRFWNVIEYWFPYRDVIDEDWDGVLAEFIPRVMAATNENEYVLTMVALVSRIDDGHASVPGAWKIRPPAGDCRLPVALRWIENQYVVSEYVDSTLAATSGLQVGDVIKSIDGQPVNSLLKQIDQYYAAPNRESQRWVISYTLTNGQCGPCEVEIKRAGKTMKVSSKRDAIMKMMDWDGGSHDLPGPTFQKLADDVAYVKLSSVKAAETATYIEQAAGTKLLIIDIRNYPSEFVPFALGQHLVLKPTPFVCFTHGYASNPGAMRWTPPLFIEPKAPRYEGKVAVLVDDASVSSSEYTAMAFRAAGATIIGSTTAGSDGNVSRVALPGGLQASLSGLGVFYPDRSPTQRIGIVPDLVVYRSTAGIRDGYDEVVEAAIRTMIGRDMRISPR